MAVLVSSSPVRGSKLIAVVDGGGRGGKAIESCEGGVNLSDIIQTGSSATYGYFLLRHQIIARASVQL